jgi:Glycosyltransferase family 87
MRVRDDIDASPGRDAPAGRAAPPGRDARRARLWWLLVGVLVAGRVVAVPITLDQRAAQGNHKVLTGDIRRFHTIATHHGTPYQTFEVEYPPLMVGAIKLLDGGSIASATKWTMWANLVLDLCVAGLLAWGWGRRAAVAYLILGSPFIVYPFLYLRLDLLSVALAVGGLALVRRRRPALGGVTLALACFAKVWPVLVAPSLLVRRSWRSVVAFGVVGVAGTAAWVGWVGTKGLEQVLSMRGAVGWEVESTAGAVLRIWNTQKIRINRGAWRFGTVPHWVNLSLTGAVLVTVLAVWVLASRTRPHGAAVLDGIAPIAALSAFMVFLPLLSPQFLAWIVPFAAIAAVRGDKLVAGLTFGAVALSVIDLNQIWELVHTNEWFPQEVVLIRNLVLVALLVVCLVRLVNGARRRAVEQPTGAAVEAAA